MLEIKGKVNTAVCYAKVIEDEAINHHGKYMIKIFIFIITL